MEVFNNLLSSYAATANESDVYGTLLGVGFTVYNQTGLAYAGAAGRQGFDLSSPAYSLDTVQWIASMTKLITTVALLQLVDRGFITLYEDLRPRFSEFSSLQVLTGFTENNTAILVDNTEPLTLRNLLTHTSGFSYDTWDPTLVRWATSVNRAENTSSWSREGFRIPLVFSPGEQWTYGASLDWAGYVLETITNQSLEEYMRENIFEPLGMDSTSFNVSTIPGISCRRADWASVSPNNTNQLIPGNSDLFIPGEVFDMYSGGAGMFSTTRDYAKFLQATMRGDLLSKEMHSLMFTPQLTDAERTSLESAANAAWGTFAADIYPVGAPLSHGLSGIINLEDSPQRRRKGSMSWYGAVNSHWMIDPESGVAAVMTTQVDNGFLQHPLALELWRELELAVYRGLV
ncbi:putative esterase [Stachybotrys elegans]|uniref:Esterase n=1 Tax=Stachybotrys elegans TaxID=80388 RepID=A0A8K0STC1_9HYPO|nr:putative esterase [Stachybotrys elegans]